MTGREALGPRPGPRARYEDLKDLLMRRPAFLLALVAVAVLAIDEGFGASGDGTPAPTEPYELVLGGGADPWCDDGDASNVSAAPADLRGPHFTLSISCLFRDAAVPRAQADTDIRLAVLGPAAPGTEFLFAQFASQADHLPDGKTDPAFVTAWIQAGAERVDLAEAPALGGHLVVSVPTDEAAVLWVEDAGRAQGLDLRTGEQVEPVGAYYGDIGFWTDEVEGFEYEDVVFYGDTSSWSVGCRWNFVDLTRTAWTEESGWAPEGSVYLVVAFRWCGASYDPVEWRLDTEKALSVFIDGEPLLPAAWTVTPYSNRGAEDHEATFIVPADVSEFKALFTPAGEVIDKATGEVFRISEMPPSTEWSPDF
ncbi:hypothetical protein [Glycomyces paridis]|uniref:Uncharacterized protein n=1 Tax=Glycomyces paridis TaxID=2126555 RepID=A0A4S8PGB6_9ACTN|nr:hypothetical protein [Glycomyces paridis]THV28961.1 hypothetical protein E9998_09385 [Glycomyces paridis]